VIIEENNPDHTDVAEIENIKPHRLRHSCATIFLNSKGSAANLQSHLGHKDFRTTKIYAKSLKTAIQRNVEATQKAIDRRRGTTPLHLVVFRGNKDLVELLIQNGADVNAKSGQGETPLALAEQREHREIVKLLQKHGAKE